MTKFPRFLLLFLALLFSPAAGASADEESFRQVVIDRALEILNPARAICASAVSASPALAPAEAVPYLVWARMYTAPGSLHEQIVDDLMSKALPPEG